MQDLPEDQEPPVTELSSSVGQLSLSPIQEREVQRIRGELRDCALYSGMGVICDIVEWEPMEPLLSSSGFKIISNLSIRLHSPCLFTIAQSTRPPTAADSSDSPPFVIAVFVSGVARVPDYRKMLVNLVSDIELQSVPLSVVAEDPAPHTLNTKCGEMNIVDDIIQPFLPQSASHLQHIPKLFFINAAGDPDAPPPQFPDDPDGNYCVAYHVTDRPSCMDKWVEYISDNLFLPGMTVQGAIENSKSHLEKDKECLHYFTCLQNKSLVLK